MPDRDSKTEAIVGQCNCAAGSKRPLPIHMVKPGFFTLIDLVEAAAESGDAHLEELARKLQNPDTEILSHRCPRCKIIIPIKSKNLHLSSGNIAHGNA